MTAANCCNIGSDEPAKNRKAEGKAGVHPREQPAGGMH
jgi:hypothetical protein